MSGVVLLLSDDRAQYTRLLRPRTLLAVFLASTCGAQVRFTSQTDRVQVDIDGEPFTEFIFSGPDVAKPFLFPLRAASGTYVNRMWPVVQTVAGEVHDHPHQKGLWFAHGDVNGVDFWSSEKANKETKHPGKIVIVGRPETTTPGTITANFNWLDPQGSVLLAENRTMTFYPDPAQRIIDFDITLTAKRDVTFGDTKEGTFAIRLRTELQEEKGNGHIVNSAGQQTEKQAWGKPANWVDYYADVAGEKLGIAIFDHPDNPRHPNRWHVRGYGLFALNPFGTAAFTGNPSDSDLMKLAPGKSLHYRFRVIIHPGDAESAGIEQLYTAYTKGQLH